MSCRDIKEKISAYIDNELSAEEKRDVEAHLALCQECGLYLEDLQNTVSAAKSIGEVEPPSWLRQKVMARLREEAGAKKGILQKLFFPLHIKLPLEAFATIAVAVTALFVFKAVQPELDRAKTSVIHPQEEAEVVGDVAADRAPAVSSGRELMQEKRQIQLRDGTDADTYQFAPIAPASKRTEETFSDEQKTISPAFIKEEAAPSADFYRADEAVPEELPRALKLRGEPQKRLDDRLAFSISISGKDVEAVKGEIEEIINGLDAEIVRTESLESGKVFFVKINSGRLGELQERLKGIGGHLKEESIDAGDVQGDVDIRIEVLSITH
jgi:hypothetical protein